MVLNGGVVHGIFGVTFSSNIYRAINQNCSTRHQPISSLQGLLESSLTHLSYSEGFISQLEVVSEIQLVNLGQPSGIPRKNVVDEKGVYN